MPDTSGMPRPDEQAYVMRQRDEEDRRGGVSGSGCLALLGVLIVISALTSFSTGIGPFAPDRSLPETFVGDWTGSFRETPDQKSFRTTLTLSNADVGRTVGSFSYGKSCKADLTLTDKTSRVVTVQPVDSSRSSCISGPISLTVDGDELRFVSMLQGSEMAGKLKRD